MVAALLRRAAKTSTFIFMITENFRLKTAALETSHCLNCEKPCIRNVETLAFEKEFVFHSKTSNFSHYFAIS